MDRSYVAMGTYEKLPDTPRDGDEYKKPQLKHCGSKFMVGVVGFAAPKYYALEDEQFVILSVERIGGLHDTSTVCYESIEGTAIHEVHFRPISGSLVFQPGEVSKDIRIEIVSNDHWDATLQFEMRLVKDGIENARLARYLWRSQVHIINVDAFPTNRFKDEVRSHKVHSIPQHSLFIEYLKMNWNDSIVRHGTIKMMMVDALSNLYYFVQLLLRLYLIDIVLSDVQHGKRQLYFMGDRIESLYLIVAIMVLPYTFMHVLQYRKLSWGVNGLSQRKLQSALLRTYMNYARSSRAQATAADLSLAVQMDSVEVVTVGYMGAITFVDKACQIFLMTVWQAVAPLVLHAIHENIPMRVIITRFLLSLSLPVVLFTFLALRRSTANRYIDEYIEREADAVRSLTHTLQNAQLMREYFREERAIGLFEEHLKKHGKAQRDMNEVLLNNRFFAPWATTLVIAAYTLLGGLEIMQGHLTVGVFLTTISVLKTIGKAWGSIFEHIINVQIMYPSLERVVIFMSLPTRELQLMQLCRAGLRQTLWHQADDFDLIHAGDDNCDNDPLDNLHIILHDLEVELTRVPVRGHNTNNKNKALTTNLKFAGALTVRQGQLAAVVGTRGTNSGGKSTLMKLLGGEILVNVLDVEKGLLRIPAHLRTLHISSGATFIRGTLYENLTLGIDDIEDQDLSRVEAICRKIGLSDQIVGLISSGEVLHWEDALSYTEQHLIVIARSFVVNPEILCLHRPTTAFNEQTTDTVLSMLREFVQEKGIEEDPNLWNFRRPRTCIFTSSKEQGVQAADVIFHVDKNGITEVVKGELDRGSLQRMSICPKTPII